MSPEEQEAMTHALMQECRDDAAVLRMLCTLEHPEFAEAVANPVGSELFDCGVEAGIAASWNAIRRHFHTRLKDEASDE